MNKIIIFLLSTTLIFSCKKAEELISEAEQDQTMAEDNSTAESSSDDISVMSDDAYNYGELKSRSGNGGFGMLADTIKITLLKADSTIIIDFGSTTGVVCKDGKTRKGKIYCMFKNGYKTAGASRTDSFSNYSVDGKQIAGTRSVTYNGLSPNPSWTIVAALTITKTNGKIITWNSTRVREMTAGSTTPLNWLDDEYTIKGNANGSTSTGSSFSVQIDPTKPLLVKVLCKSHGIQDGTITFTRNSKSCTIDYGYGGTSSCDNQALLTYQGQTKVIIHK